MASGTEDPATPPPRLLDQVRDRIRFRHYSIRTEQAYVDWIRRFIRFHGKRHPASMGAAEVELFLTNLAVVHDVSASTQNQAQSALLFLYKDVLGDELPWLDGVERAKKPVRLPVVLTRAEVSAVLRGLHGTHSLIGRLLYGTGMRILEAMRLRVKDVEFERRAIVVRDGRQGSGDRTSRKPDNTTAATVATRARCAPSRPRARMRPRVPAARACAQVSRGGPRVGMAIFFPRRRALARPAQRRRTPPSHQ